MRDGEYDVISADSHVIEPHDLWQRYIDAPYRERAPRLVHDEDTDRLVCDGAEMPPVGLLAGCARKDDEVRAEGRWDQDVFQGGYDPHVRVKDIDRDGVDAEVLYPTIGMHAYPIQDAGFQWAFFRAYNTWLADFCGEYPDRFKGIAMIIHEDVDLAVGELVRAKELGLVGVMLPMYAGEDNPYHDRRFDPLWRAAAEHGMPLHLHTATTRDKAKGWNKGGPTSWILRPGQVQEVILNMILYGMFDRYPEVKVVSAENDAGWAGHVFERADFWWRRNRRVYAGGAEVVCERPPSEYFRESVRVTFMRDHAAIAASEVIGPETLMWGSDFPHHVSTWPHSQDVIAEHFADAPDKLRDMVVRDNVRQLYGF